MNRASSMTMPAVAAPADTMPVVIHTSGQPDETWHMSRTVWQAFESLCEESGETPSAAIERMLREEAAKRDLKPAGGQKIGKAVRK